MRPNLNLVLARAQAAWHMHEQALHAVTAECSARPDSADSPTLKPSSSNPQDHLLEVLRPGLVERFYADGEALLRQGDHGTQLLYLLEGTVDVLLRLAPAREPAPPDASPSPSPSPKPKDTPSIRPDAQCASGSGARSSACAAESSRPCDGGRGDDGNNGGEDGGAHGECGGAAAAAAAAPGRPRCPRLWATSCRLRSWRWALKTPCTTYLHTPHAPCDMSSTLCW